MQAYIKQSIRALLHSLSRLSLVQQYYQGKGIVLMLHRIAPFEEKLSPNENMKVSPEFLESFIIQAKGAGYSFISLDELYSALSLGEFKQSPFICMTIDDGYKDNLTYGYPIFARHNVPFAIYICTSFLESSHNMWWFGLEDFLLQNETFCSPAFDNGREFEINSLESKEAMFLRLREHIIARVSSYEDCEATMQELGIAYNPRDYDKLTLSWEDIGFLDSARFDAESTNAQPQFLAGGGEQHKLCTIGCHTHSHPIFNSLSKEQVAQDIQKAQTLLSSQLTTAPKHFAYPFGGRIEVDSSYFSIPRDLGFLTATTTRAGTIYPQHKAHLHALPRIFFSENFSPAQAYKIRRKRVVSG